MSATGPSASTGGAYENSARLRVSVGPLAGPLLSRVVSIVAARADCPVDRLDEALIVCETLSAYAPAHVSNGHVGLRVEARRDSIGLRIGPLVSHGGRALIADADVPGVGNVLERIADEVAVETAQDGTEALRLEMRF